VNFLFLAACLSAILALLIWLGWGFESRLRKRPAGKNAKKWAFLPSAATVFFLLGVALAALEGGTKRESGAAATQGQGAVSPPQKGNNINFLQLKKPSGQGWSIDAVKDRSPYYYDSTELKERTARNEEGQDVIDFGDRPGGVLSGSVRFYLAVVEINRKCMKSADVYGTLRCYDKIKILADRFWTFNPSGSPEFSFDSRAGDSGAMKNVLQNLLDSKKWDIPLLCPVKVTVE